MWRDARAQTWKANTKFLSFSSSRSFRSCLLVRFARRALGSYYETINCIIYLKCVNVASRFALIQPRLIRISSWVSCDVASIEPSLLEFCRIGYFWRSDSNFSTLLGSANHSMRSPLSILSTINRILSMPYSPHANSTTEKKNCIWADVIIDFDFVVCTYCNRPDYDTWDMAIVPIANMAQFYRYSLDTSIRPSPTHTPVRIVGIVSPMADGSYKLSCVLGSLNASVMSLLGSTNSYRDHCWRQ